LAKPEQIDSTICFQQKTFPQKEAGKIIERHNRFRRRWSEETFGIDETDPSHYDLTISLSQIDADEAITIIGDRQSLTGRFRSHDLFH
jgi:cytidylate kinase